MKTKPTHKIALTPEQKERIRQLTGQEVPVVKLALEPIEARLTPALTLN